MARRSDLLSKPLPAMIAAAYDIVCGGWEVDDVISYMRTGLTGLAPEDCDALGNYIFKWQLRAGAWSRTGDWRQHPDGYNAEYTEEDTAANRIREGKQMLTSANFFSADYMYNNFEQTFGAPVTIKGFPTMHGVGNMITILSSYAMSSTCQHKDAAWQFLRTFLTEDYQKDVPYLPTNMNVFEKQLADSMVVEYEKDPNGNYILDENGERIPVSKGMISDGVNTYTIYATTQEQADQLRQAIADTTKLMNYDMSIADIVTEQAAAYFSGQKSAEEVAKLIQSKANIYINEQR